MRLVPPTGKGHAEILGLSAEEANAALSSLLEAGWRKPSRAENLWLGAIAQRYSFLDLIALLVIVGLLRVFFG